MNIFEIKKRAVKMEDKMETYWPQYSDHEVIDLKTLKPEERKRQYSYNNDVIAFVDESGDMYVSPDIGIQKVLDNEGYSRRNFNVPFSNGGCPVACKEKWNNLWGEKIEYDFLR